MSIQLVNQETQKNINNSFQNYQKSTKESAAEIHGTKARYYSMKSNGFLVYCLVEI